MRIAIITDAYLPTPTSAAVQIAELARALGELGHHVIILAAAGAQGDAWQMERDDAATIFRLRTPPIKAISYVRRVINEFRMPYAMARAFRRSPGWDTHIDGVVWYSPSIFHTPLVMALSRRWKCRRYLILRDIFPEWAIDLGLIKRGPVSRILSSIARRQYRVADVIGIQSEGNSRYFPARDLREGQRVEILRNWLRRQSSGPQPACLDDPRLAGKRLLVYAGNMSPAHGVDAIIELAVSCSDMSDVAFCLVGEGSESDRLRAEITRRELRNIAIFDAIAPAEVPALLARAALGLVSLDLRHESQNIPGKFVAYLHEGLPVVALVSPDSDLARFVEAEDVGVVVEPGSQGDPSIAVGHALERASDARWRQACLDAANKFFSAETAARQIVAGLEPC
jgi:glycosyltransferase involved in cell wall biosynthesis